VKRQEVHLTIGTRPVNTALFMTGMALVVGGLAARAFGWIPDHTAWGFMALSQVPIGVANFLIGHTAAASISAAGSAWMAWKWWNGGGGDGTRRRLRSLAQRFRGVRRTAPAGA
jgi:hypothetical protein